MDSQHRSGGDGRVDSQRRSYDGDRRAAHRRGGCPRRARKHQGVDERSQRDGNDNPTRVSAAAMNGRGLVEVVASPREPRHAYGAASHLTSTALTPAIGFGFFAHLECIDNHGA